MLGIIQMTQIMCRHMLRQGLGNIINVGSIYSVVAPREVI